VFFTPLVFNQNGVVAVQFKVGVAIALYFNRTGLGFSSVNFNVHILQGHIGSLIFCRLHRDGIFGLFAVAGDGDAGIVWVLV
jgi:hypothetical protein